MSVKQKFIDLVLRGKDLFSPTASNAAAELKKLQAESKETSDQLRALEKAQAELLRAQGIELYAKEAEQSLALARAEVTRLAREMDAADRPTKEQSEALKLASRSASQLQTEYNKLQTQLSRSKAELKGAGVDTDSLADEQNRLQNEIKQTSNALSENRSKLRDTRTALKETEVATESFGSKIGGATKALIGFFGAYIGLGKLKDSLVGILSTADELESYSFQFAGLFGGIAQGEQATAWVEEFAKNTGTRLSGVRDAFVQLKTFGIDPMNGSLEALVDYNAKMGGSQEKLEGIILAVGQAWGKQKLQGEEILQLVERGVPVWDLLAEATGKSTAELQKLSTAGQLGRDAISGLVTAMGNAAEGMAEAGLDRLGGQINVVSNNWENFQKLISDSGLYQVAVQFLKDLNAQFDEMANNGQLQKAAQDISNFFSGLIKGSGESVKAFTESVSGLITFINIVTGSVRIFVNGLSSALFLTAAAFTGTVSQMIATLGNLADAVGANDIAARLEEQAAAIWAVRNAYWEQFNQDSEDISAGWAQITNAITTSSTTATQTIVNNAAEQKEAIEEVQTAEQQRASKSAELAQLMAKANITTLSSLQELEAAAKATYDAVALGAEQGIVSTFEVEQAYQAWAESSLKVAAATKTMVPEALRLEAATLGLTDQLEELAKKQGVSDELTRRQGKSFAAIQSEINKTKESIDFYKRVLKDTTTSTEEKAKATNKLIEAEALLKGQYQTLAKLEQLRKGSYAQLRREYELATQQVDELNRNYTNGSITTEDYNNKLEQQIILIQILKGLMPEVNEETDDQKDVQEDAGEQIEQTNVVVEEQVEVLEELKNTTQGATKYTSLLASAQEALRTEFDFTETTTEDLNKRLNELTGFIVQNNRVTNIWWRDLAQASNEAFEREKLIIRETMAMRGYIEQLGNAALSMNDLAQISRAVDRGFTELGENDMAVLRQAITDAEARLLSFRDELQGTVSSLQDELDRLNNNQAAIEKRAYEQKTAELRAKLEAAQATGDAATITAAKEALKLNEQIYKIKQQQAADDIKAASSTRSTTSPSASSALPTVSQLPQTIVPVTSTAPSTSSVTRTVRLVLELQGQSYNADMSISAADQLLAQIERARSTSL
ncbi:tape measure protein [Alishewanella sp. HL-SH06]|uniref:tape measure protein n=1 Tax=Alishewanella sp. HL-SH06 TaxID=3461144 RepID=UPI0040430257